MNVIDQNNNENIPDTEPAYLRSVFGANLRELSKSAPSIAQLCRDLKINRTQYNRYLSGEAFPRPDVLHQICRFFKVDARILLEPLENLAQDLSEREGQSPISGAVRNAKIVNVDSDRLIPGPYLVYRRSYADPKCVTVNLVCLRVDTRGAMGLVGFLSRARSDPLGLLVAGRERRIEGMFFQHPTGFSFLTIVRNMPLWNMGFLEFAFLGNPRFFHGISIVTQRFTTTSTVHEPVLMERLDPTLVGMLKSRHLIGHTHIDRLNAMAQTFFNQQA
ncbi:MAG: transcriptional regulator with XRE-family HTH domain [Celeribacter sp.]|jgi:transcriptional regulator with XRE-family HTH domain